MGRISTLFHYFCPEPKQVISLMNIEQELAHQLQKALTDLYQHTPDLEELKLQPTRKEFEGTYTFVTFPYARISKKGPEQTGQELGQYLQDKSELVEGFNVVKGFLNLVIADKAWVKVFTDVYADSSWGQSPAREQKVVVEYSSPNTNKPLHLGHLRTNFLGYSVSQILKADGYEVNMVNLVNDRGIHICKSMIAYEKWRNSFLHPFLFVLFPAVQRQQSSGSEFHLLKRRKVSSLHTTSFFSAVCGINI